MNMKQNSKENENLKMITYKMDKNIELDITDIKLGLDNIFTTMVKNIKDRNYFIDDFINNCDENDKKIYKAYMFQFDEDIDMLYKNMNNMMTQFNNIKECN